MRLSDEATVDAGDVAVRLFWPALGPTSGGDAVSSCSCRPSSAMLDCTVAKLEVEKARLDAPPLRLCAEAAADGDVVDGLLDA